ncbi:IPTL-CTERM sorting domain-containing protein [Pseudomonas chlororaphis]|uniref:IPTL-CTERM sorting domain-containing protein n=1 Tax=Pseudomonas chlororaphis TaxID=587753 RepID=UPI000470D274|nr:IPTL-CTERM sorting domain-containing protein [Pseudomonas chlororaphis]
MNIRSASLLVMALSLLPGLGTNAYAVPSQATKPDAAHARQALQGLAVPFEANNGQFDERVAFAGKTFAGAVYITRQGQIVYSLPAPKEEGSAWSLTETLVDAAPLKPYGGEQAQTKISRFTGPKSYQAATYHNVQLGQAWPGIEVELAARGMDGSNVEKLFHVKPHADAQRIQVRLDGAESLRVGEAGELIAQTGHGDVAYTAPIAFQEVGGKRIDVSVKYALNEAGDGYGFALGMYDRSQPLVIDPLLQSTYLGGSESHLNYSWDNIEALAIDASTGDVVVAGRTFSSDFPGTEGGAQPSPGFGRNYYVSRLSGDLKMLRQSTYLGEGEAMTPPAAHSRAALAIDAASGDVLLGGYVLGGFPGTAGGALPDGYGVVARLSADLKTLVQSTYLVSEVSSIAIDSATGDVLAAGTGNFTSTSGFIARLSGDLKALRQSTNLDGGGLSVLIAIDAATGDVVVTGATQSHDFPGVAGGAQESWNGSHGTFIARLSGDLKTLRQSTYLGGDSSTLKALAIDAATGDVVVGGWAESTDFPGTAGGAQASFDGNAAGFIARLSGDLKTLRQSSYLGEYPEVRWSSMNFDVAIDAGSGDVLMAGNTFSTNFPAVAEGAQPALAGDTDVFISRLSGNLKTLRQSTYLGGSEYQSIGGLAIDASTGDVVVGGTTRSANFPAATGGAQPALNNLVTGFVARLSGDLKAVSPQAIDFPAQADQGFVAGGSFSIDPLATASSDLAVSYTSSTPSVCTVAGSVVTMVSAGTCTVVASQPGNAQWLPATNVAQDIAIQPPPIAAQNITFPAQADQDFVAGGSFAIDPAATASSGLPVSYTSSTPGVCTVAGNIVTMVAAGTCTVVASQGGNAEWAPAQDVAASMVLADNPGSVKPPEPPLPGQVTPVPVLGPFGLALMSLLAGGLGWLQLRRRAA